MMPALWQTSIRYGQVGQTTMYHALAVLDLIRMACATVAADVIDYVRISAEKG